MTDGETPHGTPAESNVASEIQGMMGKLGPGEMLAVLGAVIVVGAWVLFDLLVDEYATDYSSFTLAIFIVGAAYINQQRKGAPAPIPHASVMFVAAGLLGVLGVANLVEEVRDGILTTDFLTVIGGVAYYAGAILAGVGALSLRGK